jgi:2'-5' RNA ligase
MFAFEMFFDEGTDKYVRDCWRSIAVEKISSYMNDIEEIRPHITLAVCNKTNVESAIKSLQALSVQHEMDLVFDILASFPTSGTLFLSPTITEEHIRLHQIFHELITPHTEEHSKYYLPDHWNPHCTLAIRLNRTELAQAYGHIVKDFVPLRSRITEIGLVELNLEGRKNIHLGTVKLKPS